MHDILTLAQSISRPNLLTRAARFGAEHYDREKHLKRVLETLGIPAPAESIMKLIQLERFYEESRKAKEPNYRIAKHVEVLIALIGETRHFCALRQAQHGA